MHAAARTDGCADSAAANLPPQPQGCFGTQMLIHCALAEQDKV